MLPIKIHRKRRHGTSSKLAAVSALGGAVLGAGTLLYAREVETRWVEVNPVTLTLHRLAPEFDGYRLVQISDIHMDDWAKPRRLNAAVKLVNEQRADLISITGDFLSYSAGRLIPHRLTEALSGLRASDGIVAVLGNHDYLTNAELVRHCICTAGITELVNEVRTLKRGDAVLHITGVDDVIEGHSRLDLVLKKLPERGAAILLAHEPDFADVSAATRRFDLQLSRHSHGGQVRVPF